MKALRKRYGRVGKMPGLTQWSSFAGGGRELVFEGRKYSINPRFHDSKRSGGWSLRVSPAKIGLHATIDRTGAEGNFASGSFPFSRPAEAVTAARLYAKRTGPESHGIMAGQAAHESKLTAIMRAPDFWSRVETLRDEAQAAGDTDTARICRVAISERPVRPEGHDARECARVLRDGAS